VAKRAGDVPVFVGEHSCEAGIEAMKAAAKRRPSTGIMKTKVRNFPATGRGRTPISTVQS
jgi:hypothetical protein